MHTQEQTQQTRLLTPNEFAALVKWLRELRQWSQEQLAAISGLSERTIQRVERGQSASIDTRRALAWAFEIEDIDAFNKPYTIPSTEDFEAAKAKFDREHITLPAHVLSTGRQLAKLAEGHTMDLSELAFETTREAQEAFAKLVDYFREYRDCADLYTETQKLDVFDELQSLIDSLKAMGVSLRYAERKVRVTWGTVKDVTPMPASVAYVLGFPIGEEPEQIATPKSGAIRL